VKIFLLPVLGQVAIVLLWKIFGVRLYGRMSYLMNKKNNIRALKKPK